MKCSICQLDIDVQPHWDQGHNAEPVNAGRCCTRCNDTVVIPARLAIMFGRMDDKKKKPQPSGSDT
jgi:hypothetical protein